MERLERTVPNTEGRAWHLEHGSTTYGRWWRVCEADIVTSCSGQTGPWGGLHADIAAGATEYDMQRALAHYLDGYSAGRDAMRAVLAEVRDYVPAWAESTHRHITEALDA
jgi:hypothetical protein